MPTNKTQRSITFWTTKTMSFTQASIFAAAPSTVRGFAVHLSSDPNGENVLYTHARSVIIRNLHNPSIAQIYNDHIPNATVAKWSPSGYYIASGDIQGNVKIWDATQPTHILKNEVKVLSGPIKDIAWDADSQRIIAVGDGKERFGHCFSYDTGNSVGEISGHSKSANACSIRTKRPYRAVTCSDDATVVFFQGPPFKFDKTISDHSKFVHCVRFSPSGSHFVSVGADKKMFLYDAQTGDKVAELSQTDNSHQACIYSVSWSPDDKFLITASADMTTKIWDVEAKKVINTFQFGESDPSDPRYQQIGTLWKNKNVLSLSLDGDLNCLDISSGKVSRVIRGHQVGITAMDVSSKDKTLFTSSYDGRTLKWDSKGYCTEVSGKGHNTQISSIISESEKLYSCGMDDTIRVIDPSLPSYEGQFMMTKGQPKRLASGGHNLFYCLTNEELGVYKDNQKVYHVPLSVQHTSIAVSADKTTVAIGGNDNKVRVFSADQTSLQEKYTLQSNRGMITALGFSPDGTLLAVGDNNRQILVYNTTTKEVVIQQWVFHNARVNSIAWSPDGLHAASGGGDTNIFVWSVAKPMKRVAIMGAHLESVNEVNFVDNNTLISVGQDGMVKKWTITYPQ